MIATQGFEGTATLGDNMARIAQIRGALGVVTDGMVRDAAEIIALGLPVFCRGATPNSAFPSGPGEVGLPLAMGEVTIESGDVIIGDRDGVVVVPRTELAAVTARLELVAAKEAEMQPGGRGRDQLSARPLPRPPRPDHVPGLMPGEAPSRARRCFDRGTHRLRSVRWPCHRSVTGGIENGRFCWHPDGQHP